MSGEAVELPPSGPSWIDDIGEQDFDDAVEVIRRTARDGGTILLLAHADPDGDALGSLLALHLALRAQGIASIASWGSEPFQVPPQYTFLPGLQTLTPPEDVPEHPDLLVTLDAATPERLGLLADRLSSAGATLVVDHHASNSRFGGGNLISARAAATAVIVEELIHRLGGHVDRDIASCLYVGLVTDTGRFQYANTDRSAMELGSRLIGSGIQHDAMNRQMFETHSFGYLKVIARVLERAVFQPEASLVYSWVTQADLERYGVALEETEGLIDILRTVDAAEVVMMIKEVPDGTWRVSLRSKSRIDVGRLASELHGGGHSFSAGFSADKPLEEVVRSVVQPLAGDGGITRG